MVNKKSQDDILSLVVAGIIGVIGLVLGTKFINNNSENSSGSGGSAANTGGGGSSCGKCSLG